MFSVTNMAQAQEVRSSTTLSKCDTYFETIQSRKKLPQTLQETLTDAFAKIPVSSFPGVPGGKGKGIINYNKGIPSLSPYAFTMNFYMAKCTNM